MMKAQLHIQNNTQDNFQAQEEWSSNEEAVGKEKSPQKPYWPQIIKRCERKWFKGHDILKANQQIKLRLVGITLWLDLKTESELSMKLNLRICPCL